MELILQQYFSLSVFRNKICVLSRSLGPKRVEVTGEWRRLHNEELYAVYSSLNTNRAIKSRRLRWAGHVTRMVERVVAYRALVGKPEGRRPLGIPRLKWEDNIKMDLKSSGMGAWTGSVWLRIVRRGSCELGNEPSGFIKCGEFL
jgi:hypothetical protein